MRDNEIMFQLERLAQAFPWEEVELEIHRKPEGQYIYRSVLEGNIDFGTQYTLCSAETPAEAVDNMITRYPDGRDPEKARLRAIEELKSKIEKLQSAVLGIPPYRPNRELCQSNPELRYNGNHETVEV